MKNQNFPWEQLAKYFAGELPIDEHQKTEAWIKADPYREKRIRQLFKIWMGAAESPYLLDVDEAWERLVRNMDKVEKVSGQFNQETAEHKMYKFQPAHKNSSRKQKDNNTIRRFALAAAVILIMLTTGYISYYFNSEVRQVEEVTEVGSQQLISQDGEWASYALSDGSKITLHAGSRLEVPHDYNESDRELFLEGEAYFEVTNDSDKPLVVHSESSYTRVIGTSFLVQAWPGVNKEVEVVVSEGKVVLGNRQSQSNRNEVTISQNQKGVLSEHKSPVVSDVKDMDWYLSWTESRLVFNDRPLGEIFPRLERWYAIDIHLEDERVAEKKITAEIDYSQPMGEVLKGIALSHDLNLEIKDRTVIYRNQQ